MVVYTLFAFNDLLDIYTNLEPKQELPLDAELYRMVEDYTEYWNKDRIEEAARTMEDHIRVSLIPRIKELFLKNGIEISTNIMDGKALSEETRTKLVQLGKRDVSPVISFLQELFDAKLREARTRDAIIAGNKEGVTKNLDPQAGVIFPASLMSLEPNQCHYLYTELTRNGHFLPKDTNKAHFDYIFGGGVCPEDFEPLCWSSSKQALSELIIFIVGKKSVPRHIQRNAASVFVDSENVSIGKLSNPKKDECSLDYGTLDDIAKVLKSTKTHSS